MAEQLKTRVAEAHYTLCPTWPRICGDRTWSYVGTTNTLCYLIPSDIKAVKWGKGTVYHFLKGEHSFFQGSSGVTPVLARGFSPPGEHLGCWWSLGHLVLRLESYPVPGWVVSIFAFFFAHKSPLFLILLLLILLLLLLIFLISLFPVYCSCIILRSLSFVFLTQGVGQWGVAAWGSISSWA